MIGLSRLSRVASTSLWIIWFSCLMLLWTGDSVGFSHDSPKDEASCLVRPLCSQRATVANVKAQQRSTSGAPDSYWPKESGGKYCFPLSPTTLKPPSFRRPESWLFSDCWRALLHKYVLLSLLKRSMLSLVLEGKASHLRKLARLFSEHPWDAHAVESAD